MIVPLVYFFYNLFSIFLIILPVNRQGDVVNIGHGLYRLVLEYLFSAYPGDPLVKEAGLQECFILAGPYHSSHIVRGAQDSLQKHAKSHFRQHDKNS